MPLAGQVYGISGRSAMRQYFDHVQDGLPETVWALILIMQRHSDIAVALLDGIDKRHHGTVDAVQVIGVVCWG